MWMEAAPGAQVWTLAYDVKLFSPANAVAVRLDDKRIAVISPPGEVPETCFSALEQHGEIAVLVAPHAGHSAGQVLWQSRYPGAAFFAPVAAHAKLKQLGLRPPLPLAQIPTCAGVTFNEIPGIKTGGTIMVARRGTQPVVYLDEIIGNQARLPGLAVLKLLFWITRSAPGIRINSVFTTLLCSDKKAVARAALGALVGEGEAAVIPAHGTPISDVAGQVRVRGLLRAKAD